MTNPRGARRPVHLAATGRLVARRLREIRTHPARPLTLNELADRLKGTDHPISADGLSKIEIGKRRVDVDDLVALAWALGVAPSALLLPDAAHENEKVELTNAGTVSARDAWRWADGKAPLVDDEEGEAGVLFQDLSRPRYLRRFSLSTRAGLRRIAAQFEGLPDATVHRDENGDVVRIDLPGGGSIERRARTEGD